MEASEVKKYIEHLDHLSTIPVILNQIMDVTSDPSSPPEKLYEIIAHDQSLAEKVVSVANSSFFRHTVKVTGIEQAVMLLGYENVREISISMGVVMMLSKNSDRNMKNFWAHNYEVAFIASAVAERSPMVDPSIAFLAGLLHDTGRLIFYNLMRKEYRAILGTDDLLEKEFAIFGCDHSVAGGWLAEKAQLSQEHISAIRYHHSPSRAREFQDMVSVIALAEALSRSFNPKIEDDGIWNEEHDAILLELALSNDDILAIGEGLKDENKDINSLLGLA